MNVPDRVEVYLPIVVTIDTDTGELETLPYADFEGAPWMYVGEEANVWMVDEDLEGEWVKHQELEEAAMIALDKVLARWRDR